jgi:hypothetical protein
LLGLTYTNESVVRLKLSYSRSLESFRTLYGFVLHFLTLVEGLKPFPFNDRKVDEDVFSSRLLYEAEPFAVIEPLDLPNRHLYILLPALIRTRHISQLSQVIQYRLGRIRNSSSLFLSPLGLHLTTDGIESFWRKLDRGFPLLSKQLTPVKTILVPDSIFAEAYP